MTPEGEARVWTLRLTVSARDEIRTARQRMAEDASEAVADRWQEGLESAIATLATFPERGAPAQEAVLFGLPLVRQHVYRRTRRGPAYRILYRLHESPEDPPTVVILAVRHGARAPMTQEEAQQIESEQ